MGKPDAESSFDEFINPALVFRMLSKQHADLAALPLTDVYTGWDNTVFCLGRDLAVRLPRRRESVQLILHEQRWLPLFKNHLPVAIPTPVRIGVPQDEYPWPWSIVPWVSGKTADIAILNSNQPKILANIFKSLHIAAPKDAPRNPYRGVSLFERVKSFEMRLANIKGKTTLINEKVLSIWAEAITAPLDVEKTWIHGDMHPRNIIVNKGCISGLIDWGDMCEGDRASDLAAIWMLFTNVEMRRAAIDACGLITDATWKRARGWAILYSVVFLETGLVKNPYLTIIAERTLKSLLEDIR